MFKLVKVVVAESKISTKQAFFYQNYPQNKIYIPKG